MHWSDQAQTSIRPAGPSTQHIPVIVSLYNLVTVTASLLRLPTTTNPPRQAPNVQAPVTIIPQLLPNWTCLTTLQEGSIGRRKCKKAQHVSVVKQHNLTPVPVDLVHDHEAEAAGRDTGQRGCQQGLQWPCQAYQFAAAQLHAVCL